MPIPLTGEVKIVHENFTSKMIENFVTVAQYYDEFRLHIDYGPQVTISSQDALWIISHKRLKPACIGFNTIRWQPHFS